MNWGKHIVLILLGFFFLFLGGMLAHSWFFESIVPMSLWGKIITIIALLSGIALIANEVIAIIGRKKTERKRN